MKNLNDLKREAEEIYERRREEIEEISLYIHGNPELEFNEYKAQKILSDYLEAEGFQLTRSIGNIETSFEALYDSGRPGKCLGFMAEYDALENLGHACGHNIIASASVAGGLVLKELMEKYEIPGSIKVLGTPAEEGTGAKVNMLEAGVFKGLDWAMIMHPADASMPDDISFASANLAYKFRGKPAHAAAFPWKGKNALNALIQMFNLVDSQRIHLKDHSRIHGIILEGGRAHNVIPDYAEGLFNIRTLDYDYLVEVMEMVDNCAKGAALATGTELEIELRGNILKDIRNDKKLVDLVRENMKFIGEDFVERSLDQGIGSTDAANVTHELPAIQFYIRLKEDTATHTKDFEIAAGNEYGKRTLGQAAKVLAMTGLDLLLED